MTMKIFLCLAVLCVSSVYGDDMFGGIFKAASDMMSQTMNMGMSMMQTAMDMVPFDAAIRMAEQAINSAKNYPQQMIMIFRQGAEQAAKVAGVAGDQVQKSFQDAVKEVEELKAVGAPKEEYTKLMDKMKAAASSR